jgi:hypothetical protein
MVIKVIQIKVLKSKGYEPCSLSCKSNGISAILITKEKKATEKIKDQKKK